jgi:hypothetical protein
MAKMVDLMEYRSRGWKRQLTLENQENHKDEVSLPMGQVGRRSRWGEANISSSSSSNDDGIGSDVSEYLGTSYGDQGWFAADSTAGGSEGRRAYRPVPRTGLPPLWWRW